MDLSKKITNREKTMTRFKTLTRVIGVFSMGLAATLLSVSAQAEIKMTPALKGLVKAAAAEGTLNVVWGPSLGAAKGARALQDSINKTFGINIKINYTPGPSMPRLASRVIQEIKAGRTPSTDVFLGAETTLTRMIRSKGVVPVTWRKYFPGITKGQPVNKGMAVHIATLFSGIYYNAEYIKPNEVPKKMADIFNPKWKGKIASTPYAAGFDRLALARGIDVIRPVVQKTAEWTGGLMRCGEYERLASGEFIMLFLDCGRTDDRLLVENGGPLGQVVIEDAAITTNWYFGVPTKSAHPNLATLFAGFVATSDGQKVIQKYGGATSHRVPGTLAHSTAKKFAAKGVNLLVWTPDDLLKRSKDLAAYRKEFQRTLRAKHKKKKKK
jgi:ABC-type Fe3+ transport system substrate-binding protein